MTEFPHASVVDGIRFTAQVGVPNVLQGLFKKRIDTGRKDQTKVTILYQRCKILIEDRVQGGGRNTS